MKPEIVKNFVDNSILKPGSELLVSYINRNTFGMPSKMKAVFKVVRVISAEGKYYFTLVTPDDDKKAIVAPSENIIEIDGMTSDRIIKAFNLKEDGTKKPRKPRKRKTKIDICQTSPQT